MDIVELTRQLGAAIQADERYVAYAEAKRKNDEDQALGALIGKLNIIQLSYRNESEKENPDEARLEKWDAEFRNLYTEIMRNEKMLAFQEKKQAVDDMMNYLIQILNLCVNGADPATCEPVPEDGGGCTGSCSTCGGCG
ncbi:MAG: YlbF family regulator [Clostridia bacterium]|nr:YlbF family regulator [Clostridia bacterium]